MIPTGKIFDNPSKCDLTLILITQHHVITVTETKKLIDATIRFMITVMITVIVTVISLNRTLVPLNAFEIL